ncbi:MAG: hypothetical protein OEV49_03310 [candidate division Zixibacteria bacterium]|nr:hypothetical protein [candidate division Zixibacteria bacterium]MDH3936599.1 hypothetical protein [candidate division Zixibacteria bacterium]MDH4035244.1 hypothetical protein [candidate division Zixibacteria bacterium]
MSDRATLGGKDKSSLAGSSGVFVAILSLAVFCWAASACQSASASESNYQVVRTDEPISWLVARDSALALGGQLAAITSQAEQDLVLALLASEDTAWIGGSDVVVEGRWAWYSGERWSYAQWAADQPESLVTFDYLQMLAPEGGDWQAGAEHTDVFVVEYPCCGGSTGNVDGDTAESVDIADLVFLVDFVFTGGAHPFCTNEADLDASGRIDIADLVFLVDFMMRNGSPPPACAPARIDVYDTVVIVDNTGKPWDISYGVHYYGMDVHDFHGGYGPFSLEPIIDPVFSSPGDGDYPEPDEDFPMLGITLLGESRAYKLKDMLSREIVDDDFFDSIFVAATY